MNDYPSPVEQQQRRMAAKAAILRGVAPKDISVRDCGLTRRAARMCLMLGLSTLQDLLNQSPKEIMDRYVVNFGTRSMEVLQLHLAEIGVRMKGEPYVGVDHRRLADIARLTDGTNCQGNEEKAKGIEHG